MVLTSFSTTSTEYKPDFRYLDKQGNINCGDQGFNDFKLHNPAKDGVFYEGNCGGVDKSNLGPNYKVNSPPILVKNGRLENLQSLPVDCSNKRVGGVVSKFQLMTPDSTHNVYQYNCMNLANGKAPQCGEVRYTEWVKPTVSEVGYSLDMLDRHTVKCGEGESVSSFVLQNGANPANPSGPNGTTAGQEETNRIKYTCCKAEACGANGMQYRSVTCKDQNGNVVDNGLCSGAGTKPVGEETCTPPAIFNWAQGGYVRAICDTKTNKVTQEVLCKDQDGNVYTDEYCSKAGAKPSTTKDCDKTYSWLVGKWQATKPVQEKFKFTSVASSSMHHYALIALFIIALLYIIKRK